MAGERRAEDGQHKHWRAEAERSYLEHPEDPDEVEAMGRLARKMIRRATPGEDWSHLLEGGSEPAAYTDVEDPAELAAIAARGRARLSEMLADDDWGGLVREE